MEYVYKVVSGTYDLNKFLSLGAGGLADNVCLDYELDKTTRPKVEGSPIFAFDTEENALSHARHIGRTSVFRCTYEPFSGSPPQHLHIGFFTVDVQAVMDMVNGDCLSPTTPPEGTVFCDSVTLVEKVWP